MSPDEQRRLHGVQADKELQALGLDAGPGADTPSEEVDLRAIPRDLWDRHLGAALLLPEDVAAYVAGMTDLDTMIERDGIEGRVIAFHGLSEPFNVVYRDGVARLMRTDHLPHPDSNEAADAEGPRDPERP